MHGFALHLGHLAAFNANDQKGKTNSPIDKGLNRVEHTGLLKTCKTHRYCVYRWPLKTQMFANKCMLIHWAPPNDLDSQ